ncbi:MAG: SUMF1/EgtB/PvdO family nonheme iron enzyme, partial [Deltaproteobacteria bacterium]|nr:SUMF1/EgtB/PvdO family nonheme iron enzyme [Deltaproteobacteria bacterium]
EDIAWYCNNSNDQLHPVAWKQPNPWGLYDMLGNVSEWVDYFTDGESLDYMDGHPGEDLIDPIGRTSGTSKDIRGFEFRSIGCRVRASRQNPQTPDVRGIFTGFRPVRTLFE